MTDRIAVSKASPATTFYLECDRVGQSVDGNYTTIKMRLRAVNNGNTGSNYGGSGAQVGYVDGIGEFGRHSGTPFLPSGYGTGAVRWNDGDWYFNVPHNDDGSRGAVTLRMRLAYGSVNEDHTVSFNDFPTIARASMPSFAGGVYMVAGDPQTINTNRASSSFTHSAEYFWNGAWTLIGTGITNSVSWTPPLSMLTGIPNSWNGTGLLRLSTYNGGNFIGARDLYFNVQAPASVIPTWTSVAAVEANSAVASTVGAFVQGVSKLGYTITGAAGVYGSTISLQRFSAAGQSVDGASGTLPNPINQSGIVPVTWLVQDSRGRQKTQTTNLTFLPYVAPVLNSVTVRRALSDGTPDADEGTYMRVDVNALVQSLMNGTQRNIMQIRVKKRLHSATTDWATIAPSATINPTGITYNSFVTVAGPFLVDESYDIRVEVSDRFNTSAYVSTIAVGAIFMEWSDGLGLGKYWENGMLDVAGDVYATGGFFSTGMTLGLLDPAYVGPGPARVYNLENMGAGLSIDSYEWQGQYYPWGNRVVNMKAVPGGYVIDGHNYQVKRTADSLYTGGKQALTLANNWVSQNFATSLDEYSDPTAIRLPSGIVALSGLITGGTLTVNTVITTLPVGMRPDTDSIFNVINGTAMRSILVKANGQVQVLAGWTSAFVSLDGITFPAAGVATWTAVGSGGSAFANSWTGLSTGTYGTPAYWKDPYGFVWFRGIVTGGSTASDNTNMVSLPTTHRAVLEQHHAATAGDVFGFVGARSGDGLNWKSGTSSVAWVSLAPITLVTQDSIDNNVWFTPNKLNSWVDYSGAQPSLGFCRRPDGLAISKGLIRTGTINAPAAVMPKHLYAEKTQIQARPSNAAFGRSDIVGYDTETRQNGGNLLPQSGSNAWYSFDGMKWVVG